MESSFPAFCPFLSVAVWDRHDEAEFSLEAALESQDVISDPCPALKFHPDGMTGLGPPLDLPARPADEVLR